MEVDGDLERIELSDDVAVTSGRFRLSGDELILTRGPRGLEVDGRGRLAFCPCDQAPVSMGFRSATIAPPTDLILERATFRIGPLPVVPLPVLWMRSPRRLGLLPPHVSWRAEDGLFAGGGLHVPLEPEDRTGRDLLDLRAGGYLRAGAETRVDLVRRRHVARVRWDYVDASLLDVEGHGVASRDHGGHLAWRADLLRGPRADRGTPDLGRAVRRHDRLRIGLFDATPRWVGGVGLRSDLVRGGAYDDLGAFGPQARIAFGRAVTNNGALAAGVGLRSLASAEFGDASLLEGRSRIFLASRPGPLAVAADWEHETTVVVTEVDEGAVGHGWGRITTGVPLVRRFGRGADPLVHWLEPGILLQGTVSSFTGVVPPRLESEPGLAAGFVARLHNAVGRQVRRAAMALDLDGGGVTGGEDVQAVTRLDLQASGRGGVLGVMGALDPESMRDGALIARARVGRLEAAHLDGWVDGGAGRQAPLARWLRAASGEGLMREWFDGDGWSAGGGVGVPLFWGVTGTSEFAYDLSAERLLAVRGGVRYRHRCRCLSLTGSAGHRVGRRGVDAWVMLDLIP